MARIYQPRQKKLDSGEPGPWHMTVSSDEEGWCHPIGYCGEGEGCTHESSAEAEACWQKYRLDKQTEYDREDPHAKKKCEVCDVWTQNRVLVGREFPEQFVLCPEHATRETLERLLKEREAPPS